MENDGQDGAISDALYEFAAQNVRRYVRSTNRALIDEGANWILQGSEQEQRDWTAGVKALYSMLASTTFGLAKELVKQGLSDRNGMVAFVRVRERFGKTAGVAKLSDVFQFQCTSSDSLEDKWLRWLKLMKQVRSGEGQGTISGTTLTSACSTKLGSVVCKCGSVLANEGGFENCSAHTNGNRCCRVNVCLLW